MKRRQNEYRYNLLLVNPGQDFMHYGTQLEMVRLLGKKIAYTSLALPIIAALTPDYYHIRIIDECIEPIPDSFKPDIVGISTYLASTKRAFEIARRYTGQNIPVVFGGPWVTYCHEEGLLHATSVVIGEAEGLWEQCLRDFEAGELKRIYSSETKPVFKSNVIPRWDLVDTSKIMSVGVQTRRGCPYMCEFCLVSQMFGRKVRYRDLDNVLEELRSLPIKNLIFVDDNFITNKKYTFELLERIKPMGFSWICQASLDVALDEDLLKKMAEAGCRYIVLGFESVNRESISETKKLQNTMIGYRDAIQRIHKYGIIAYGSFIVGFDHDTAEEFDNIYRFSLEAELPYVMVSILGVTPGTELFNRIHSAGRWVDKNKRYSGGMFPVLHYYHMSQQEIFVKYIATLEKLYSYRSISERSVKMFSRGTFIRKSRADSVSFKLKLRASVIFIIEYLLSTNADKRKFFIEIWKLVRGKKLCIDVAAPLLLAMLGYNIQIRKLRAGMPRFLEAIAAVDKGPWKELTGNQTNIVSG
jgi:radical SAM superfamily enzyme YgiQ (UPF0313 family)